MPMQPQHSTRITLRVAVQLILVSLVLMSPAIYLGHIVGHSSVLNVNWANGFEKQLAQGVFYPRWLPEMNGGAGSPVFYFYGPLPFFITAPFVALTGNDMLGVVLGSTTMLAASGFAAYLLCRIYASRNTALLAATLYMMMPYHFSMDIWYRSAFGEQAAFVFMPLAAYFAIKLADDWRNAMGLSLSFAAQVLSHLPTALLFAPLLAVLCCWVAWRARSLRVLVQSGAAGILALGLAAIYILPAATLQAMIQPDYWRVIVASDHLLLTNKMQEDFSFFIFPQAFVLVLALYFCVVSMRHWTAMGSAAIWAVIALIAIFFSSILSQPFWNHAGPFSMVQLPWRLFCLLDLATIVLFAHLVKRRLLSMKFTVPVLALAILLGFAVAGGAQYLYYHMDNSPTLMTIQNDRERVVLRADASEYLPNCLDQSHDEYQAMTYRRIAANKLVQPEIGMIPVYYYPFLEAASGGNPVSITCDPKTGFIRFDPAAAGQGPITLQAKTLPIEQIAALISVVSLLVVIGGLLFGLRRSTR
ncbi:MAG: glycosyltransferase family 39 protein [Aestuariivirga sp.]